MPAATPEVMPTATPATGPTPIPPVASDIVNFDLEDFIVTLGATVTWTNRDSITHTATSGTTSNPMGRWDSDILSKDEAFSFTFTEPGTYAYFCEVHPITMLATVVVLEEGQEPSA